MNWKTGTPDHGKPVLAVVEQPVLRGDRIRRVIIRAIYIPRLTEKANIWGDEYEPEVVYNEETDAYYYKDGWYEQIDYWGDLYSVYVDDPVTHWQELPKLP